MLALSLSEGFTASLWSHVRPVVELTLWASPPELRGRQESSKLIEINKNYKQVRYKFYLFILNSYQCENSNISDSFYKRNNILTHTFTNSPSSMTYRLLMPCSAQAEALRANSSFVPHRDWLSGVGHCEESRGLPKGGFFKLLLVILFPAFRKGGKQAALLCVVTMANRVMKSDENKGFKRKNDAEIKDSEMLQCSSPSKPTSALSNSTQFGDIETILKDLSKEINLIFVMYARKLSECSFADASYVQEFDDILKEARSLENHLKQKRESFRSELTRIANTLQK